MSQESELREVLAPMSERQLSLDDAAFRVDRARVLARMAAAGTRQRPRRAGFVMLAAAGVLAVVGGTLGARLWWRGSQTEAAFEVVISEGTASQTQDELATAADSKARVRTSEGLELELRGRTRVALGALQAKASRVKLLGGAIRCTVPHRTASHAFEVETSDVTVVDLGTIFTVSVDGPDHETRVAVEEGEVLVKHAGVETRVQAPGAWSSAPVVVTVTPEPLAAPVPVPAPKSVHKLTRAGRGASSSSSSSSGTLALEAQLLRQGLTAERQGRSSEAVAAWRQLLAKYPQSPLATDARAALARVEAGAQR